MVFDCPICQRCVRAPHWACKPFQARALWDAAKREQRKQNIDLIARLVRGRAGR